MWPNGFLGVAKALVGLALIIFVSDLAYQYQYMAKQRRHGCAAPRRVKQSKFLMGLDHMRNFLRSVKRREFLERHSNLHKTAGRTWRAYVMGSTVVNTCDAANVKAVLSIHQSIFEQGPVRHRALHPVLGDGIVAIDGPKWSKSRRLVKPALTTQDQISTVLLLLGRKVDEMLQVVNEAAGRPIDLQPLFLQLTMNTTSEFLFGRSIPNDEPGKAFVRAWDVIETGLALRAQLRVAPLIDIIVGREFWTASRTLRSYVRPYVEEALASNRVQRQQRHDLVGTLADEVDSVEELIDHVMNLLGAGRNSTASLLSTTLFVLARHPRVWAKLQEEVSQLNGRTPDQESIHQLKFLSYVLKEVLRLYPPIPIIVRQANKDVKLPTGGGSDGQSGVFVPKNQLVVVSIHAMHRLNDVYGPDADEFWPERWEALRPQWAYLPFSGGPRTCVGQQFALMESSFVIVRLLQEFTKLEPMDGRPFKGTVGLTVINSHGTLVSLSK